MTAKPNAPTIHISEAAQSVLRDVADNLGVEALRFEINEHFDHQFVFRPWAEGDITIDADGLTLLLDPASAQRADGVTVDYVREETGATFKVTNPNTPRSPKQIALARDCEATRIPGGQTLWLAQGERVVLMQALGGSFTIKTSTGFLARIAGTDADALGLSVSQPLNVPADGPFELQRVIEALKTVYDPEIPVNVVDLGLIYACEAHPIEGTGQRVEIKMSMTAPGCGMGDVLKEDARSKVLMVPGVAEVDIELVWDPPWDQDRMSDAARLQLGML